MKNEGFGAVVSDKYRILMGIVLFGSIWGMLECVLGSLRLPDGFGAFPMGAVLGGFFGIGIMAYTRRVYGVMWMQLGMGLVAGFLRFWAPIGTCVVCSALAIVAESLVFEILFNRPMLSIRELARADRRGAMTLLASLGIVAGYSIYVTGYIFTQIMTPLVTGSGFVLSDFASVLPLILGRGFFAALCGAFALPLFVLVRSIDVDVANVGKIDYYVTGLAGAVICWSIVFALHLPRLLAL
jgi:hypothetical protein